MLQNIHIFPRGVCYTDGIRKNAGKTAGVFEREERNMLDLLTLVLFCWIFYKAIGLAFKAAWGVAKIAAMVLFAVAWPLLIGCLLFAGGLLLLLPVALLAIAFGILKACV